MKECRLCYLNRRSAELNKQLSLLKETDPMYSVLLKQLDDIENELDVLTEMSMTPYCTCDDVDWRKD